MALARLTKGRHVFSQARSLHQAVLSDSCRELASNPEDFVFEHASDLNPSMVVQFIKNQTNPDLAYRLFSLAGQQDGYSHNAIAYKAMLHCLCKFKQFDLVPTVLRNMITQNCQVPGSTLAYVLTSLAAAGMAPASFILLKKFISQGSKVSHRTYSSVVGALLKGGKLCMAVQLLEKMIEVGIYVDNILAGMVTNALCKGGKVDGAMKLVENLVVKMPRSIDQVSLHGLVGYLCNEGRTSEALKLTENMRNFNVLPNIVTYNKLMAGLCNSGDVNEALRLCHNMLEDSISPDFVTLSVLLNGLCKQLRVDEAVQLFRRMGSIARRHPTPYNILVHALCKQKRIHEAWDLASEMVRKGVGFTIYMYSALIYGLLRVGEADKALELRHEMNRNGIRSDLRLCKGLIAWLCNKGKLDDALNLLAEMVDNGSAIDADIFCSIVSALCKANRVPDAMELCYEMMRSGYDWTITVFNPILEALCTLGDKDQAFKLLDVLLDTGAVPSYSQYCAMLKGLCIAKQFDDVRNLLTEMKKNGFDLDLMAYTTMINANAHCVPGTVDLFIPLIGSNIALTVGKYVSLLDGLFQTGEVEFALKVVKDMQRAGFKFCTVVFNVVIDGLCKNHMVREAQEYFVKMRDCGCSPDHITYTILIYGFCQDGQLDVLDLFYREMQADGCKPDALAYGALLLGFAKGEKFKEFYGVLDDMKEQGCTPTELSLDSVFEQLRHKDVKRVRKYLQTKFGIAYEPKVLNSIEHAEGDKLEKSSSRLVRMKRQHKIGEIQKLPVSQKPFICNIKGTIDSFPKEKYAKSSELVKSVRVQSAKNDAVLKLPKSMRDAYGCLLPCSPSLTNKPKIELSTDVKDPPNGKKNCSSMVLQEESSGEFMKQINADKNQKKSSLSHTFNNSESCGKLEQSKKGVKFKDKRSNVTLLQKALKMDNTQKSKQQKYRTYY